MKKVSLPLNSVFVKSETVIHLPFLELRFDRDRQILTLSTAAGNIASLPAGPLLAPLEKMAYFTDELGKTIFLMREYDSIIWAISISPHLQIRRIEISKREEDTGLQCLEIFKCDEWYVISSEREYAVYDVDFEQTYIMRQNPFSGLDHSFLNGVLWFLASPPSPPVTRPRRCRHRARSCRPR